MIISETITVKRSLINFAPYNPREDDPEVVKSIKTNFKKVGYLGGIVWNENTGNLVSGHKRLQALDLINRYEKGKDYEVKVEKVFMDLKTEKEQNIYMNNKNVQGVYDYKALSLMLPDLDINNTGLSALDLDKIEIYTPQLPRVELKTPKEKKELREDQKPNIEELKELKKEIRNKANDMHDDQERGHLILVFDTWQNKIEFMEYLDLDLDAKMLKGEHVLSKVQILERL